MPGAASGWPPRLPEPALSMGRGEQGRLRRQQARVWSRLCRLETSPAQALQLNWELAFPVVYFYPVSWNPNH